MCQILRKLVYICNNDSEIHKVSIPLEDDVVILMTEQLSQSNIQTASTLAAYCLRDRLSPFSPSPSL